eukprot:scaffold159671_cov34-Tisochrysis_lutea.AAC.7
MSRINAASERPVIKPVSGEQGVQPRANGRTSSIAIHDEQERLIACAGVQTSSEREQTGEQHAGMLADDKERDQLRGSPRARARSQSIWAASCWRSR